MRGFFPAETETRSADRRLLCQMWDYSGSTSSCHGYHESVWRTKRLLNSDTKPGLNEAPARMNSLRAARCLLRVLRHNRSSHRVPPSAVQSRTGCVVKTLRFRWCLPSKELVHVGLYRCCDDSAFSKCNVLFCFFVFFNCTCTDDWMLFLLFLRDDASGQDGSSCSNTVRWPHERQRTGVKTK